MMNGWKNFFFCIRKLFNAFPLFSRFNNFFNSKNQTKLSGMFMFTREFILCFRLISNFMCMRWDGEIFRKTTFLLAFLQVSSYSSLKSTWWELKIEKGGWSFDVQNKKRRFGAVRELSKATIKVRKSVGKKFCCCCCYIREIEDRIEQNGQTQDTRNLRVCLSKSKF